MRLITRIGELARRGAAWPARALLRSGNTVPFDRRTVTDGIHRARHNPYARIQIRLASDTRFDSHDLRSQIPSPLTSQPLGAWRQPTSEELLQALSTESALFNAIKAEGEGGVRWVARLSEAIGVAASARDAKGAELIFRFRNAYSARIAHIALGTVWRDPEGQVRVSVLHQESLPGGRLGDKPVKWFAGQFYDRFDTATDHPQNIAPVVESLKLMGLPDVNAFPCSSPNTLPGIVLALQVAIGLHAYGPGRYWPGVAEARAVGIKFFGTCFTATHVAHVALMGKALVYPENHSLDWSLAGVAHLACVDMSYCRIIPIGGGSIPLDDAFTTNRPVAEQQHGFLWLGTTWGESWLWDVTATRSSEVVDLALGPGQCVTDSVSVLLSWSALQFHAAPTGVKLDGRDVGARITYSRDECARMSVEVVVSVKATVAHRPVDHSPGGDLKNRSLMRRPTPSLMS